MVARNAKSFVTLLAAVGGFGLIFSETRVATATLLTGPVDTIYSDNFAGPAVNVNAPSTAIVGNTPAVETGLDGGSATSPYIGIATPGTLPDAVWQYSGSNSASITSPPANVVSGEDTSTITNLTLPLVPTLGWTYDLEATLTAPAGTGGHGLEMAFLYNNGNGHNTSAQAISNNDPAGLILDRDAVSGGGYFDIFEGTGTNGDTHFAPTASSLTGGSPGSSVTVDILFTSTGATTGSLNWYLNGILANPTPVAVSGLTGGISDIQIGDNRDACGTITNFSLTAVPEPTVAGLAVAGSLVLGMRRRRRQI